MGALGPCAEVFDLLRNYLGNWTDLFEDDYGRAWAATASGAHLTFNLELVRTRGI